MFQKSSPISTISLNIRHDDGNPAQLETQPLLTHSFATMAKLHEINPWRAATWQMRLQKLKNIPHISTVDKT